MGYCSARSLEHPRRLRRQGTGDNGGGNGKAHHAVPQVQQASLQSNQPGE